MNTKIITEYKKTLKLSNKQKDILVGLLLGDGHLETLNQGRTFRLKIEHSLKQEDYVKWLYKNFKEWTMSPPYRKKRKNGQESVGFTTYSHGALRFYGQQFYCKKKKIVPKIISKLLTPMGIAVWFMDDGSRKSLKHKTYIIHTLGYSKNDLEILQKVLVKKFNIKTKLHKQKEKYLRLYVLSESADNFRKIIESYIKKIVSMRHKIG